MSSTAAATRAREARAAASRFGRRAGRVALALAVTLLGACAAPLPPLDERRPSTHLEHTERTRLGRLTAAAAQAPDLSGVHALRAPLDAFAARVLLIRAAERSLDVQYYIWHADTTGLLLLGELLRAADRGVRVRLLLDDNGIEGLDPLLAALDAHANVEVRLFNPFVQRRFKALGYLGDFQRLNRRMHNKSLTADVQATIVGGRNVGDAYYGADPALGFADLDVLAVGPVAREVGDAFDEYWNSDQAYPARAIIGPAGPEEVTELVRRLQEADASPQATSYADAVRGAGFLQRLLDGDAGFDWVPVQAFNDPPSKARKRAERSELLMARLSRELGQPERQLEIVSPYFVPGAEGSAALARLAQRGVQVRVVTNSLAATDVTVVHVGYALRREELLRAGVRLFELKPDANVTPTTPGARQWLTFSGGSTSSLHGKTFAVDRQEVFVGSFNFDPRSLRLNTEMGLLVSDPALAGGLTDELDRVLGVLAYEVRIADDGALEWIEHTATGEQRYRAEPKASLWRQLGAAWLSILPLESLL